MQDVRVAALLFVQIFWLLPAHAAQAQPTVSSVARLDQAPSAASSGPAEDRSGPQAPVSDRDSLVNGALIGAAIGGGLTSLYFLDNECHDDPACCQAVAAYAGIGALVGMGIDALIHRDVSGTRGARSVLKVGPFFARARKGVRVTFAF